MNSSPLPKGRRIGAYLILFFLAATPLLAQDRSERESRASRAMQYQIDRSSASPAGVPLEGAIDEAEYIVGPGDVFVVTIGGAEPMVASVPVSADGRLLLPAVGGVRVAGLSLAEARERAMETLRPSFQRVRLDIALIQPRQFYVHVSGAVPVPGRYLATPVARLSTVLELAFADTSRIPVSNPDFRPSFRDITLRRPNGASRSVDLQRYLSTGDTRHNPYLNDGDVISVGVYDPVRQSVFIDGAVPFPGAYAFREGDTTLDLIALASGDNPLLRGVEEIRVTSRSGGAAQTRVFRVAEGEPADAPLSPLDHVYVRADDALRGSASVEGWVRFPGTYPVEPGLTTLAELVDMAGGLRDGALLRGVHLERKSLPEPRMRPLRSNRFDAMPEFDPAAARADTVAILRSVRLADLDFLSRAYFAQEMRLQNRVAIDPSELSGGTESSIVLQDGDRLIVPRDEGTVYVFGQVNRPGFVAHRTGLRAQDYIDMAGGASSTSSAVYVVEAGTGRHTPLRQAGTIGTGDMIFVDRRQDIADTAEMQRLVMEDRRARAENRFRTTQTIVQVVGTAASVLTTFLVLRSRIDSD